MTSEGLQFEYQSEFLEMSVFRTGVKRILIEFSELAEVKVEAEDIFWYVLTLRFHSLSPRGGVNKLKLRQDATVRFNLSKKYLKTAHHFSEQVNDTLKEKRLFSQKEEQLQPFFPTDIP